MENGQLKRKFYKTITLLNSSITCFSLKKITQKKKELRKIWTTKENKVKKLFIYNE